MRWLKRITATLTIFIVLLLLSIFVWLKLNSESVTGQIITELNKHLATEVKVESIDLHFWQTLPRATVRFNNVIMHGSHPFEADTLMAMESVSASFHLWDLYSGNYSIDRINLYKGYVAFRKDAEGKINYNFLRKSEAVTDTLSVDGDDVAFALETVRARDVSFSYHDRGTQNTAISLILEDATFSGRFHGEEYDMSASGEMFVNTLELDEVRWMQDNKVDFDQKMHVNSGIPLIELDTSEILIDDIPLHVHGSWRGGEYPATDFELKGEKLDVAKTIPLIPEKYRKNIANYDVSGFFDLYVVFSGAHREEQNNEVRVHGDVYDAALSHSDFPETLTGLHFSYDITDPAPDNEPLTISLSAVEGRMSQQAFTGEFLYRDPDDPVIDLQFDGDINLAVIYPFLAPGSEDEMGGILTLNDLNFSGRLSDLEAGRNIDRLTLSGKFSLKDGLYSPGGQEVVYDDIEGALRFDGEDLLISSFGVRVKESRFRLNGYIQNLVSYFFAPDHRLVINASVRSPELDVNDLLWATPSTDQDHQTVYEWAFPSDVALNLTLETDRLNFNRFSAANVSGRLSFLDETLYLDALNFGSMEGNVSMEGRVSQNEHYEFITDLDANIRDVAIEHLFYQCYDFGQDFIRYDHLGGRLNGDIRMQMTWLGDLSPDLDGLEAIGDLKITGGRLVNFDPVMQLSRYADSDRLSNLQFNELNNRILIRDRKVMIPEMDIRSNALDILLSGEHSFDNQMEYYMRLSLHELLFGKRENYQTEFGDVIHDEEDKLYFHVVMTGHGNDPSLRLNSKRVRRELAGQIQREKADLEDRFEVEGSDRHRDESRQKRERELPPRNREGQPSRTEREREDAFDRLRQRIRDF